MEAANKKEIVKYNFCDSRRVFIKKSGIFLLTFTSSMGFVPSVGENIIKSAFAINFCPYCGEKLPPNAKFCPKCGKSLDLSGENNSKIESYEKDKHKCELDLDHNHLSGYLTGPGDKCVFNFTVKFTGNKTNYVHIYFSSSDDVDFWVKYWPRGYSYIEKSFKEIREQTYLGRPKPYIFFPAPYYTMRANIKLIVYSKSGSGEWTGKIEYKIM